MARQSLLQKSKRASRLVWLEADDILSNKQLQDAMVLQGGCDMLVLRRKPSETIYIGDDIVVKLIRTDLGSAKIGIEAPRNIRILRAELCDDSRTTRQRGPVDSQDLDFDVVSHHEADQSPRPLTV